MMFDGKTVSVLGKDRNVYAQLDDPGSLDELIDAFRVCVNGVAVGQWAEKTPLPSGRRPTGVYP
jgi:hypothetical protein